jgi:hypothetical protein
MKTLAVNKERNMPAKLLLAILGCAALLFINNGLYLVSCFLTIWFIVTILWKSHRPGVLVFVFLKQWLQVVAFVVWMNVMGYDVNRLVMHGGVAVIMSCLGLAVIAFIISQRIKKLPIPSLDEFKREVAKFNEKKIFLLYLISTLFLGGLGFAFGGLSGFTQILTTLGSLKWVFFLLFGYVSWLNNKNRYLLILMITFEFASGIFSYFSNFKEVLLYTIILSFTFITRITIRQLIYGILFVGILGYILLTWTAIKSDYRKYLNKGTKEQQIYVSKSQAFTKIGDQLGSLTVTDYQRAGVMLLYRAQYIYHLAITMDRVPDIQPHENGKIWWENVSFVIMPRILFPNKPIYQATIKTNKYTGMNYSGFAGGTSFSLGYFADSYVDFGYLGMFIPLGLIALYISVIFRSLYNFGKLNLAMRYAVINVALYEYSNFEADGLFLFGRLTLMFMASWAFCKWVLPRLQIWLYK